MSHNLVLYPITCFSYLWREIQPVPSNNITCEVIEVNVSALVESKFLDATDPR